MVSMRNFATVALEGYRVCAVFSPLIASIIV